MSQTPSDDSAARDAAGERLTEFLRSNGLKITRQRQVIFQVLLDSSAHLSLEELFEQVQARMEGIGYATVYRTMKMLTDAGLASERRFGDGQARYELSDSHDHHDHLICEDCGHIFEFEDELIERRQAQVAAEHGLRIVSHRHDIWGRCDSRESCSRWQERSGA